MRQCILSIVAVLAAAVPVHAQPAVATASAGAPAPLTLVEQERFLLTADIKEMRGVKVGVTGTRRATLSDGRLTHDASVQTIDESHHKYETSKRVELNFRDFWGYNVAAYRLGVLLGLDMIPPSVVRRHRLEKAAFTWWIDDVAMDERERTRRKLDPPDASYHTDQVHLMRAFDELIANTDRNQGNMLFDTRWKLWMIDHSRAFRLSDQLRNPKAIRRCERTFFERLRSVTREAIAEQMADVLTKAELSSLLKRRDELVARVESLGPGALYDLVRPTGPAVGELARHY